MASTNIKWIIFFGIILLGIPTLSSQHKIIHGTVESLEGPIDLATVTLVEINKGVSTDANGYYIIREIPEGKFTLAVSYLGFESQEIIVDITNNQDSLVIDIVLEKKNLIFDQIVVTGTKTFKRQTNSAVIVNVVDSKTLDNVQACNLSEGLKFQPGIRVETDCQTCNYTQLRMNGLAGGYSQILINGRPIFSPLTGLYGLEQIPSNMIDRIEVIRGGGSSLYGSSAIGGTVNVLTKIPTTNAFEVNSFYQNINGRSNDFVISGNTTIVSKTKNSGASFFLNRREREAYDHNDDLFSEIPELQNTSLGTSMFLLPTENQKIEFSLSNLNEYRYGGEMVDKPAYLTLQSEERTHNVWLSSLDYQINFNKDKSSFIAYGAWQNTKRKHYTGIFPDVNEDIIQHIENPPYGTSLAITYQGGFQLNHKVDKMFLGTNVFTLGGEYVVDDINDEISAYNYLIDQNTKNIGVFLQSDWELLPSLNLLSGFRLDHHSLVDNIIMSPRLSLLYKYKENTQYRLSYGTGFRAPQAFDADLHIAFAGGGVSRVLLSPELNPERSESFTASINYDKPTEHYVAGFTAELFNTRLNDAFFLQPIGQDEFGELFEKQNGSNAVVQGLTLELRANFDRKLQIESGFTIQRSLFDSPVQYIDEVEGIRAFIRTPNQYGFASLSFNPNKKFSANFNYVYTGSMIVPHFAGAPNQSVDEIIETKSFSDLSLKLAYVFSFDQSNLELYGGIKNVFNSYQDQFDIGKNRDSNFVYGPGLPRTSFIGIKWFFNN